MPDIWLGRFSRSLEKLFNVKGGPLLVDAQPSVMATLALDKGVDQRYLEGWNRFAVAVTVTALAANVSRVRLRNPVGSNVITVIEQIAVESTVLDSPFVTWGAVTTDLTTLATLAFTRMDPRGNPQPTSIVSSNQQAAGGQPFLQRSVAANATIDFIATENQEIPNLPGQAVDISANTANTQILVSLMWRERPLESSELT